MSKSFVRICFELNSQIELCDYELNAEKLVYLMQNRKNEIEKSICETYSSYGYCKNNKCSKSHDIELIIKLEIYKKEKQKFKKLAKQLAEKEQVQIEEEIGESENLNKIQHNAGLDAFMTGFVMLNYLNKFSKFKLKENVDLSKDNLNLNDFDELDKFLNKLYLTGKDFPLIIQKSKFSNLSNNHQTKKLKFLNKT